MSKDNGYLNDEINKLNEDRLVTETKVKAAQYSFAENIKRDLGPQIKKTFNPSKWERFKNNLIRFFKTLDKIYG